MKVNFYVNYKERQVASEQEFEKMVIKLQEDYFNDTDCFAEFLSRYPYTELFDTEEKEKEEVRKAYKEECCHDAKSDLLNDWEEEWIEA